ncbi:3',5'-cyclic AMP phosphodiesterase CpdA [Dokdonella fugitiva]|uniref:3',5'-cyclic AMP phosphodiesterase CpdA n=1 Tax=Dokdonella fugitiva TaxID=328517 RepID=A0A839F5B9_9GAMM|nr:metallophosphoesterase [Dokdonella fugitiva]MBA8889766.1 3',5'-cyclic AMP phosphodiesterase CpdA [Dokdonella fugitiva]
MTPIAPTDPTMPPRGDEVDHARRSVVGCLAAWSGAAIVWTVAGGVPRAALAGDRAAPADRALRFVQISDTHIGFHKDANPDVVGSLRRATAEINALPQAPAFVVHTGDVSHLSKAEEFGQARELLAELRVDRVHTVPGEHDALADGVGGYLKAFDLDGAGRSWYSFDQGGVHFIGLDNVRTFSKGRLAAIGDEQLAWLRQDLAGVAHSMPIVVLAHIPLWTVWEPWGWGTADSAAALALLRPYGSVTVLNGHVHQVLQKVEGHVALHTAMSLAYPLPTPGQAGVGEPGPVTVPAGELGKRLGTREVHLVRGRHALALVDMPLER